MNPTFFSSCISIHTCIKLFLKVLYFFRLSTRFHNVMINQTKMFLPRIFTGCNKQKTKQNRIRTQLS